MKLAAAVGAWALAGCQIVAGNCTECRISVQRELAIDGTLNNAPSFEAPAVSLEPGERRGK